MSYSLNGLYRVIGISKQAVHRHAQRSQHLEQQVYQLMREAELLRAEHPGCGVEKMYYTLAPSCMGRDKFVELFMALGYRVRRPKNYQRTTYAGQMYYPNLIKGLQVRSPSSVWQSDITYIRIGERFFYAVFIIDVYTKMVVGYRVSKSLRAEANVQALRMALRYHDPPEIHHSDRGSQYIYGDYIKLLRLNNCKISMACSAQENAYAERINQTIKDEYLKHWSIKTFEQLQYKVGKAVKHYNEKRIHRNIDRRTPSDFQDYWKTLSNENKPIITIFDNN